jgi:hypothetical protein
MKHIFMLNLIIIMNFNEIVYPRKVVYQDIINSNPHWRQANRIFQPLTEGQFRNRFGVGDRVTVRLKNQNRKMYISARIANILPYHMAVPWLDPYNINSAYNTIPFTRVLILDP